MKGQEMREGNAGAGIYDSIFTFLLVFPNSLRPCEELLCGMGMEAEKQVGGNANGCGL